MITAKEADKLTKNNIDTLFQNSLSYVYKRIKEQAEMGFNIYTYELIPDSSYGGINSSIIALVLIDLSHRGYMTHLDKRVDKNRHKISYIVIKW